MGCDSGMTKIVDMNPVAPIRPTSEDVLAARHAVQTTLRLGITDAQDWCALAVHTKRRPWQQWETGERRMHPAFWELFKIKVALIARA